MERTTAQLQTLKRAISLLQPRVQLVDPRRAVGPPHTMARLPPDLCPLGRADKSPALLAVGFQAVAQ